MLNRSNVSIFIVIVSPHVGPRFGLSLRNCKYHSTSVQQTAKTNAVYQINKSIRCYTLENLNLEKDSTFITMADQACIGCPPTKSDSERRFRQAIETMLNQLGLEIGASKEIVLILLTIMAQYGASYYQTLRKKALYDTFCYKNYHLTGIQVLNALTKAIPSDSVSLYEELKIAHKANRRITKTGPSLFRVFVELQEIIYYIADLGNLEGDLYPRYLNDNTNSFTELGKQNPRYHVWLSSFQIDNPNCPIEILLWFDKNWSRLRLDPMLDRNEPIKQEGPAQITYELDEVYTIDDSGYREKVIKPQQPASAKLTYELDEVYVHELDTIDDSGYREEVIKQEQPAISVYQINKIDGSRYFFRFDTLESLNLENDSKLIAMAGINVFVFAMVEQYVFNDKPTKKNSQYYLTKAIATMFARLVQETGAPKSVVLILLAIMAQKGGSYYQTYMRNRLDDEFYYKEFHLSIRQVLNALTDGITCGHVSQYSELKQKKQGNPFIIKTKPSLRRVFQKLQDEIYYIADLGNLEGDLYPRYLNDNTNSFAELGKQNPRSYVWYSSFQVDNPHCPLEIREWLKANRHRFMLDPKCHRIEGHHKKNKS